MLKGFIMQVGEKDKHLKLPIIDVFTKAVNDNLTPLEITATPLEITATLIPRKVGQSQKTIVDHSNTTLLSTHM